MFPHVWVVLRSRAPFRAGGSKGAWRGQELAERQGIVLPTLYSSTCDLASFARQLAADLGAALQLAQVLLRCLPSRVSPESIEREMRVAAILAEMEVQGIGERFQRTCTCDRFIQCNKFNCFFPSLAFPCDVTCSGEGRREMDSVFGGKLSRRSPSARAHDS